LCTLFRLFGFKKMTLLKNTATFEGSAGFEETRALILAESAFRNSFVPGKAPARAHSAS